MKRYTSFFLVWFVCVSLTIPPSLESQTVPKGQSAGAAAQQYLKEEEKGDIEETIRTPRPNVPALDAPALTELPYGLPAVYIRKIVFLNKDEFRPADLPALHTVVDRFSGDNKSFDDIARFEDTINAILRETRYTAYIPDQTFTGGVMYLTITTGSE